MAPPPQQAGNADVTYGATDFTYGLVTIFSVNRVTTKKETFKGNGDVAAANWSGEKFLVRANYTHLTDAVGQANTEVGTGVGIDMSTQHPLLAGLKVFIDEITDELTGGETPEERSIDFVGAAYPDAAFNV